MAFDAWFCWGNWEFVAVVTVVVLTVFWTGHDKADTGGFVTIGTAESTDTSLRDSWLKKFCTQVANTWLSRGLADVTTDWHMLWPRSFILPESLPSWEELSSSKEGDPSLWPVTVKRPCSFLVTFITFRLNLSFCGTACRLLFGEMEIL